MLSGQEWFLCPTASAVPTRWPWFRGTAELARHEVAVSVAGQAEHPLGDDVPHDLVRSTADGGRLGAEQLVRPPAPVGVAGRPRHGAHPGHLHRHQCGFLHQLGHGSLSTEAAAPSPPLALTIRYPVRCRRTIWRMRSCTRRSRRRAAGQIATLGLFGQRGEAALAPTSAAHVAQGLALEGSMERATRQPSLTSPTTLATGTRTSSRKTSLKWESPVICRSGRTVMPGTCMSTMSMVMPSRLGRPGRCGRDRRRSRCAGRPTSTPSGRRGRTRRRPAGPASARSRGPSRRRAR